MKINKWTIGLAAVGLVSLAPALHAQATNSLLTSLSATTISGYVDTSAVWNPGTGNANPAPYSFNAGKQDGFNIDDVDIKLSHPFDSGKWSAGYVAEMNAGPDAAAIDGGGAAPIRQAYVDLEVPVGNGIELKLGRWDNILGYETSDSMNNPNWTRSYGYTFEPTEHTGLLASYQFASWISAQLGVADTLTTVGLNGRTGGGVYDESKKAVVSLLTLTAPDNWGFLKGSALYAGFDHGPGGFNHDTTEWYFGTTLNTPVTNLTLGASWDSIDNVDIGGFDGGYFSAYAGYLSYKLSDKSSINGRAEYADGTALNAAEFAANGGSLSKVFALTATFEYDLWANVMSRLEVRWDRDCGGGGPAFGGNVPGVPQKYNEILVAANVIYKF